jgi:hypothetical protein
MIPAMSEADKCAQLFSRPTLNLSVMSRLPLPYMKKLIARTGTTPTSVDPRPLNKASDDSSQRMSLKKGRELGHGTLNKNFCVKHYRQSLQSCIEGI